MAEPIIQFTRGVPPPESFPKEQIAQAASDVIAEFGNVILQYGPSRGFKPLREWIAKERGVDADNVVIGQGSLQLVDVCARMLIRPGDLVYVEAPSYDRTLTILKRAGARVVGFPLLSDGPDVDQIEARLRQGERPQFFYLIPDFQNPSGTVLSLEKRQRILALAEEYDFWVMEDVPYRRLRYRNAEPPSFLDLSRERVMQLSSYSKQIAPGLRVGFMVTTADHAARIAKYAEDTYINSSYFNQAVAYAFAHTGWLDAHLLMLKDLYCGRLDTMLAALDEHFTGLAEWHRPDGGFFIGMNLHSGIGIEKLMPAAAEAGLALTDGRGFFADGSGESFIRLPFCALKPEEIQSGIARLAAVVKNFA